MPETQSHPSQGQEPLLPQLVPRFLTHPPASLRTSGSHFLLNAPLAAPFLFSASAPLLLRLPGPLPRSQEIPPFPHQAAGQPQARPPLRPWRHPLTLYHMTSGSGFPSTTTAKRAVSPAPTSTSSMMDSNRGASETQEVGVEKGGWTECCGHVGLPPQQLRKRPGPPRTRPPHPHFPDPSTSPTGALKLLAWTNRSPCKSM